MIRVTLDFPKTMSAADVFQSLYDAGAATTGHSHRRPTIATIDADADSATAAFQLGNRLSERGVSVTPTCPPKTEEA